MVIASKSGWHDGLVGKTHLGCAGTDNARGAGQDASCGGSEGPRSGSLRVSTLRARWGRPGDTNGEDGSEPDPRRGEAAERCEGSGEAWLLPALAAELARRHAWKLACARTASAAARWAALPDDATLPALSGDAARAAAGRAPPAPGAEAPTGASWHWKESSWFCSSWHRCCHT